MKMGMQKLLKVNVCRSFFLFFILTICVFPYRVCGELFRFQADTPIYGFAAPFFGETGVKTWECTGEQVRYLSDVKIKIRKMCITFFEPHRSDNVDMVVRSDRAVISIPGQRASGKTLLTVSHATYTVIGENWFWEGKHSNKTFSRIFIGKNASVMFYD